MTLACDDRSVPQIIVKDFFVGILCPYMAKYKPLRGLLGNYIGNVCGQQKEKAIGQKESIFVS